MPEFRNNEPRPQYLEIDLREIPTRYFLHGGKLQRCYDEWIKMFRELVESQTWSENVNLC